MATPFSVAGTLNLPGTPGLPDQPIPFSLSGQYVKKAEYEYDLTGSGSQTVNLGNIISPGAKMLLFMQDLITGAATVLVKPNGSLTALEVSPGGGILWWNPTPAVGLTSLTFDYTAAAHIRVWVLG